MSSSVSRKRCRSGTELTLVLTYSGLLRAQDLDEAWIGIARQAFGEQTQFGVLEPRYVYSNRSYWYPQSTVTDYATATLQLTVPADFRVVASGDPAAESMTILPGTADTAAKEYTFITPQPARYLSCLISRFVPAPPSRQVTLGSPGVRREERRSQPGVFYDRLALTVETNERNRDRVPALTERAVEILGFYASLISDFPYPTLTLTVTDGRLPGGHSPAYFVVLNELMPGAFAGRMRSWRSDPVSFSDYPSFFLAHELAHQWWGHAVGPKNYHERWLSEGLAQYFSALYAQHEGGDDLFGHVLKQMHEWALRHSREGPIYLGYRLGHIEGEPRGVSCARLQQSSHGAAHVAAADRRRQVLRRPPPLLRSAAVPKGRHRRSAAGVRSRDRDVTGAIFRTMDPRGSAASAEIFRTASSNPPRCRTQPAGWR